MQLLTVPAITTIVYWTVKIIKIFLCNKTKFKKYIPLFAAVYGAVLGCAVYFIERPDSVCSNNFLTAIILGGVSGLSATGADQMIKQLKCKDKDDDCD